MLASLRILCVLALYFPHSFQGPFKISGGKKQTELASLAFVRQGALLRGPERGGHGHMTWGCVLKLLGFHPPPLWKMAKTNLLEPRVPCGLLLRESRVLGLDMSWNNLRGKKNNIMCVCVCLFWGDPPIVVFMLCSL